MTVIIFTTLIVRLSYEEVLLKKKMSSLPDYNKILIFNAEIALEVCLISSQEINNSQNLE